MKVGLLIDDHMARPGGVQEYVRGLGRFLLRHDHEVVIFSSGGPSNAELRLIRLGSALNLRGSGSSTSIPITFATRGQLRQLLEHETCDLLHVMAPYSPTLSGRLLRQSRACHVMTFLVAIEPGPYRAVLGTFARLQAATLRRFEARIAISETAAATGRALYGGSYDIIPCGVDTTRFVPHAAPLPELADGCANILYVGRLEQRKGVDHLVRAFARLQRQAPAARLIIAGDGPERRALEQLVAELKLTNVRFLGYVSSAELPHVLASGTIFCAPATYAESFGIVLVEALAAGLPIVAAGNAGYAGLLAAHPGNLVVPPADDRALAGALAALLDQPAYRQQLGARNRAAAEQYSWEQVGQALLNMYRRLLETQA